MRTAPCPTAPVPLGRILSRGRPAADAACAGCAQLGLARALRRAGLGVQGGPGCDPEASRALDGGRSGAWAAVTGAAEAARDPGALLARAAAAGARLVVVADRLDHPGAPEALATALARAGARAARVDPGDLDAAERAVREAASRDGAALVALSPCVRGAPRSAPLAVSPARCNRCGACLALGCPALSDPGGEAMVVDASACTGCGLCAPLCRGRAIAR